MAMKPNRRNVLKSGALALLGGGALSQIEQPAAAQRAPAKFPGVPSPKADDCNCTLAADGTPLDTGTSELRPVIERYSVELQDLNRIYGIPGSALRHSKTEAFYANQLHLLEAMNFDALSQSGKVDYLLLRNRLQREQRQAVNEARQDAEIAAIIPFQRTITGFEEARRRMETLDAQKTAAVLSKCVAEIAAARAANPKAAPQVLYRAASRVAQLRNTLRTWYNFYDLYDPKFSWWVDAEYKKVDDALDAHSQFLHTASGVTAPLDTGGGLGGRGGGGGGRGGAAGGGRASAAPGRGEAPTGGRAEIAGIAAPSPGGRVEPADGAAPTGGGRGGIRAAALGSEEELSGVGRAGNDSLIEALHAAMIPYTPDELIALANKEFAWCDREMLRASNEMGFGNDWKKAQEAVKNKYVDPGQMIYLVRDQSREAIEFMEKHEVLTIPAAVKEDYWEEAMTPQMQLVNPFFTGGTTIQVSSPANSMTLSEKLESLRGNNIYFSRTTVFHELVPGHHMQGYMTQRYRTYRRIFSTPFWSEGMAFYWEMLMWDLGFTHTPEQRIGALFWRMHRCARIIFSLSFHLGKMTAKQCVDFLVDRVGFERTNAEGEVRRSFNGSYEPIYQCAYMLGALQFRALHKELVESGKMTNRTFHDAFYRESSMPIEMVRLAVSGEKITRDYQTSWKFYGSLA
jgi:uncharacterized protein (DUF885 family)